MATFDKKSAYEQCLIELDALLEGESDTIAIMATMACILKSHLPTYYWSGFYLHKNGQLIIGPYQGTIGCLHITLGKGVCGTAAAENKTLVVADVHDFPGHIACDAKSRSEIVVPIRNSEGQLLGVLDVDSCDIAAFDGLDQHYLELMVTRYFRDRQLT